MKTTTKLLLAAAIAGAVTARPSFAANAMDHSSVTPMADKASCKSKDGCKAKDSMNQNTNAPAADKASCKAKASCKSKDGCKAKDSQGK